MPGPAPKHPSRRARSNNAKADFTVLPLAGRSGVTPRWPLSPDVAARAALDVAEDRVASLSAELAECDDGRKAGRLRRQIADAEMKAGVLKLQLEQAADLELEVWSDLWRTPQATLWEASRSFREVALYVRLQVRAEQGHLASAVEARQWSDRLGMNPLALLRLRVEIENAEAAQERSEERGKRRSGEQPRGDGPDPRSALAG